MLLNDDLNRCNLQSHMTRQKKNDQFNIPLLAPVTTAVLPAFIKDEKEIEEALSVIVNNTESLSLICGLNTAVWFMLLDAARWVSGGVEAVERSIDFLAAVEGLLLRF